MKNATIDLTRFVSVVKTSPGHVYFELSDLGPLRETGGRPDTITVKNRVPGRRDFVFTYTGTKRDNEGEAEEFGYKFIHPTLGTCFRITLFND